MCTISTFIRRRITGLATALFMVALGPSYASAEKIFATPEEAASTLVAALKSRDEPTLVAIFGKALDEWLRSGDDVADRQARELFLSSYDQKHQIEKPEPDKAVLVVGNDGFPFPIPIVKDQAGWVFDADLGRDEIIARRVGRNELSTIQTLLAIADAQADFADLQRGASGAPSYAPRFLSNKGKRDGLYWPAAQGEPESPLGPLVAEAAQAGYGQRGARSGNGEQTEPYNGYRFRMLKAQGANAPGGAYSYVVNGRMVGGFAVLAWPARYGVSGYKSFMISHDRVVWERDLGADTERAAAQIRSFDPVKGWSRAEAQ